MHKRERATEQMLHGKNVVNAYTSCAKQMKPPSCVRRTPAGESASTIRVFTFLFAAICISLCNLVFWRLPARYLSVSMR
jgi:hypothetical protein